MPDVFRIAEILKSHALTAHTGEIAIIAYYGSYATGQQSATSDLDLFYIPEPGKASTLCSQFIIDDLPYDFWPVSWEFAEAIANASSNRPWAVSASLIASAQLLYARSPQDQERFEGLQKRIQALTGPDARPTMVEKALQAFEKVLFQQSQLRLAVESNDQAGAYGAAWELVNGCLNCLALVNQTYFSRGWGVNFSQALQMDLKPEGLEALVREVTTPAGWDAMPPAAGRLVDGVRQTLLEAHASLAQPASPGEVFKDFYYFIFEYVNKVESACRRGDVMAAGFAAYSMQSLICRLMHEVEHGYWASDINLLGTYTAAYLDAGFPDLLSPASQGDLAELASRVRLLDERARAWFGERHIDLNILADETELRRFLMHRDPVT